MYIPVSKEEFEGAVDVKVVNDVDFGFDNYVSGILDVRDHQLTQEESNALPLGNIAEYNLQYERSYIDFIERVYEENRNSKNYVDCYLEEAESSGLLTLMDYLDYRDKLVFLELLRKGVDKTPYLELNGEILSTMVKFSTRELSFTTLFFTGRDITIWGNYDMAFPVFFKSEEDKEYYRKLAGEYGLYIREA